MVLSFRYARAFGDSLRISEWRGVPDSTAQTRFAKTLTTVTNRSASGSIATIAHAMLGSPCAVAIAIRRPKTAANGSPAAAEAPRQEVNMSSTAVVNVIDS